MFRSGLQPHIEAQAQLFKDRLLSESIQRTNRIAFKTECQKRLDKYRQEKEIKLADRRQRLLDLLLCEAKLEQSMSHQILADEKKSRRDILIEEANRYRQLLESKNREVAEAKYDLQFYQNAPELRNRIYQLHAQEIQKDRTEIQKIKEQDAREKAEWEQQLLSQKSHFDEQLDREAKQIEAGLQEAFVVAEENERMNKELKRVKEEEKQNKLKEEKAELEKLHSQNVQISEAEQKERRKRLEEMRQDIEEHRKRRSAESKTESAAELYCYPKLKSEPVQDRHDEMKRLREEQLRFMDYKKEMEERDKCFDCYMDQQYLNHDRQKNKEWCEKRKLERAKYLEIEKEIMENNRKAIDLKTARVEEERLERLKLAEECRRKQKELEEQIRHDEQMIRQKNVEFGRQLAKQKEAIRQWRENERQRELALEKKHLEDSELEYQRHMEKLLKLNPLYKTMHPWRKHAMGMTDSYEC